MKKGTRPKLPAAEPGSTVTTLELFFDLVFVLTITQLTRLIHGAHDVDGYLQAGAILLVTWWMYDGYAWLSNNVGPTDFSTRVPMLLSMAGFLIMAVATPDAFGDDAWAFGIANLFVVTVHALSFLRSSVGDSARAIWRIAPVNFGSAAFVLLAAALPADIRWVCWALACLVLASSVVQQREIGFDVRAEHFAERHRLLIIVALGETVVATGVGAEGRIDDLNVVAALLLSLALLAQLWWVYFGGDDDRGAQELEAADPARRARLAMMAYALAHLVHIVGLILIAAGIEEVVAHPSDQLHARTAVTMAAGGATFLLGEAFFMRTLEVDGVRPLAVAALVLIPTFLVGTSLSGLAQVVAMLVVVGVLLAVRATGAADADDASERPGESDLEVS